MNGSGSSSRQLGLDLTPSAARGACPVFSIGHSNRPIEAFVALLRGAGVVRLADIRSVPYSRRHPQFSRDALARSLEEAGIAYAHWPALGGKRQQAEAAGPFAGYVDYMRTPPFVEALRRLAAAARATPLAFMCAEASPADCHRRYVGAALELEGLAVTHLGASRHEA
ncbi:MAG: DUF488 domain-containing protein [Alphaproteobacteria bacterium]|nr:DUF488 domain-containing protein [Alphaproteobacteria bacterium]